MWEVRGEERDSDSWGVCGPPQEVKMPAGETMRKCRASSFCILEKPHGKMELRDMNFSKCKDERCLESSCKMNITETKILHGFQNIFCTQI